MGKTIAGFCLLGAILTLLGCGSSAEEPSVEVPAASTTNWGNARGNPQNTGLASASVGASLRAVAAAAAVIEPDWVFDGSGSPNGSFAVIDKDGSIYYQGTDKYLYAVKADGTLKWKILNAIDFLQPVIGPDGRIYIGDYQNLLYCLDPLDGRKVWSKDFGNPSSGFTTAPIVTPEGMIYIASLDGNLYAVDLNGNLKWTFNQASSFRAAPGVAKDGTVYAVTDHLFALNPKDGTINWSFKPADNNQWNFESNPVIADNGHVYILGFYDSFLEPMVHYIYLFSVDKNGNELWRYELHRGSRSNPSGKRTSPALMTDGTILVSVNAINKIIALNPNGSKKTEKTFDYDLTYEASPSVDGRGSIYITYKLGFGCLSKNFSTILWEKIITDGNDGTYIESSPSIGENSVYFTTRKGNTGGSLYRFSM